jgi:hypothetical protein
MQTQWNELLATALLGTEQRQRALLSGEAEGLEFLASIEASDPEQWLLLASAYACTYRRAGQIPPEIARTQTVPAASAESKQRCSMQVANRLVDLLQQAEIKELFLVESLTILTGKGRLVPPALLPDLFEWAKRNKQRRALLVLVVGERGKWLAMQNPEWKNVLQVEDKGLVEEAAGSIHLPGEQAVIEALELSVKENFLSKALSFLPGQGGSREARLVQAIMDKLLADRKDRRVFHSEQGLVKMASVMPPAILPQLIGRMRQALSNREPSWLEGLSQINPSNSALGNQGWFAKLAELIEYRHQMLEELANE